MLRIPPQQNIQSSKKTFPQTRWVILAIAVILIIGGTFSAIVTQGSWGQTVSLILTALGTVLAIYQILIQPYVTSSVTTTGISGLTDPAKTLVKFYRKIIDPRATGKEYYDAFRNKIEGKILEKTGTLVIYASEYKVGLQIVVSTQRVFNSVGATPSGKCVSGFIALHTIDGHSIYAVVFSGLLPGSYHIWLCTPLLFHSTYRYQQISVINVEQNQVTEYYWQINNPII